MVKQLFVFFLFTIHSFSQQIKFENFTTNQGLSNNSVLDIKNDKDGGLWIATGDGLNYFDGNIFKIFKNNSNDNKTISSNYITNIEKDSNGHIWLLTIEGDINKYVGNNTFEKFKFKELPKNIHLSYKGNIVVQTKSAYYEFRNNTFIKVSQNSVKLIQFQNLKNILLKKHPNVTINDVLKDKKGNIWFATRENGLYIIKNESNKNKIEHYVSDIYEPYSFKTNEIRKLNEDYFGNIWLGLKDGGISMAYNGSEKINSVIPHPIKEPYLPAETIRAITRDRNGKIWLGYYSKGIYFYNENTHRFEKFKVKEAILSPDWDRIRELFLASDGTIWVGTYNGILHITGNKYISYEENTTDEFRIKRCYSFYVDQKKQLWIGTKKGLSKFNLLTGKFENFKEQKLLSQFLIRCIKKDDQELLLATENNGLITYNLDTKIIHQVAPKNGILGNSIYSVLIDKKTENYWIASLGGISVYNKKQGVIKNLTETDGLPSHMVYGLIDNGNEIWASTTKGIVSVNKKNYKITNYDQNQGWQASEFSEGAYYQDSKGILFFGGVRGLNYFNPNSLKTYNSTAKIKLKVDGEENYAKTIQKSFTNNDLEIEIIPIIFPTKDKIDIYYKLKGNDKKWSLLTAKNKIEYRGLSSGEYIFLIKEGKNGVVKPACFLLQIGNPFYETMWFYILLSGLSILTCVTIIYYKNKKTASQKKYLEELVIVRTTVIENQKKDLEKINEVLNKKNKKIAEQKEKLLVLHSSFKDQNFEIEKFKSFMLAEFQDPINKIIKISSTIKKDTEAQHDLVAQSGRLVNLLSEWNHLEHVKDLGEIKKSAVCLFPILKKSIEKLKKDVQHNQVNFYSEIDNSSRNIAIDVLRLKLLFQYFFHDFSKHSDTGSTLNVIFSYDNDFLEIEVTSDSILLKENWFNISQYSPYFKALKILLDDLKGELIHDLQNQFQTKLRIPLEIIDQLENNKETISWKNFNHKDPSQEGRRNLLVFSDETNFDVASQVLEGSNSDLVFESAVSNLNAIVKQIKISGFVFYQSILSKELLHFLKQNKESDTSKIPMIYISEEINYELNEQLLEAGIDTLIQLPTSTSFIDKKINLLINQNKETEKENKMRMEMFKILTDENDITTSNEKLLKKALDIIKNDLQDPNFNVEMLANQLDISRIKCYRLFKEALNQSPSDILMSLRLQKAEILLKTKKLNISEISFECGYNDPKYFGRSFKKYFGKSPKEYKEQFS